MNPVLDPDDSPLTAWLHRLPLLLVVGTAVVAWTAYGMYAHLGTRFSLDLRVYRAAAHSLIAGHNPYHQYFTGYHLPFTYPPAALLAFSPFTMGSVHIIEILWWLINAIAVTAILYLGISSSLNLSRTKSLGIAILFAPLLSLIFEPLRTNTSYGQINVVLLLLVVVDLTRMPKRYNGVLVGIAGAIKLTPLVYLLYFAAKGERRSLCRGLLVFVGIGSVLFLVVPVESGTYWLHQVFDPARIGTIAGRRNQSWYGLLHRWPFAAHWAVLPWLTLALVTLGAAFVLVRRLVSRNRTIDAVVALGMCTALISPVSWSHHWVWIILIPILLVRGFSGQPLVTATMVLLCLVGAIGPYAWNLKGWSERGLSNTLVLTGALAFFTWVISELRHESGHQRCLVLFGLDESQNPHFGWLVRPMRRTPPGSCQVRRVQSREAKPDPGQTPRSRVPAHCCVRAGRGPPTMPP